MAFYVINCSFDYKFFESSMIKLRHSTALCVMVSYLPDDYGQAAVLTKVLENFTMIQSDFFFLLVKQPFIFNRYNSGTWGVIFGSITFCDNEYGIIASQHYDMLMETADVIQCLLPTVLACLDRLRIGGLDFGGEEVKKCKSLVVYGSLFCQDYPVKADYIWPDFSQLVSPEICEIQASMIHSGTCTYQPFKYDWRTSELYIESLDRSDLTIESEVDSVVSICNQNLKRGFDSTLSFVTNEVQSLGSSDLQNFYCKPFLYQDYQKLVSNAKEISNDPEDFCFASSWVQVVMFGNVEEREGRGCVHPSNGPDVNSSSKCQSRFCNPDPEDDFVRSYAHEVICTPHIPIRQAGVGTDFGHHSLFMRRVEEYYLLFVQNGYGVPNCRKEYRVIHKHLLDVLQRLGQACIVHVGRACGDMPKEFCAFDVPHGKF